MRPCLTALLCLTLGTLTSQGRAFAACDVQGAKIEEQIAAKPELQKDANAQTVRDLRTLRDAAIVLETYKYPGECEVLLGIARSLLSDPADAAALRASVAAAFQAVSARYPFEGQEPRF